MQILVSSEKLDKISADALALFLFEGEKPHGELDKLDKAVSTAITQTQQLGDFKGKLYEVASIYTHGKIPTPRVLLTGAVKKAEFNNRATKNVAGAAARRAIKLGVKKLAVGVGNLDPQELILGVGLANFDPGIYKTKKDSSSAISELILVGQVDKQIVKTASALVDSVNWVRQIINQPANLLTPSHLVGEIKKLAAEFKLPVEILDEDQAAKKGFGAFVGIAKGSEEPSFMTVLEYRGGGKETLGLVGKGITFDSGGISLKPSDKMHEMKMDMAGAAACLGAMRIVGLLKPKINVICVTPLTENLPGGKALKPGDVLTSLSGKTIEILNTDAEGRVVLADALTYAQKLGATKIVDLATLTGAVQVALGSEAAAILGNRNGWIKAVTDAADSAGERLWQLPIYPEHKELLKSDIADVANIPPSRGAGVIAGAVFLQEFVADSVAWAHLDIASTAWLEREKPYMAKGPTGFGIATLVKLIENLEKGS